MIKILRGYLHKQKFNPDLLGVFINPFFFARRGLYRNIKKYSSEIKGDVLDVGCGRKPYKHFFSVSQYVGMDIENPGHDHSDEDIDVYYDGTVFPFAANHFDSVLCNQVFEHVFNPVLFMAEINRVLKPNGKLLLTVPFVWDEHEQPYDFARYSSFGIKSILEKNGFEVLSHTKSVDSIVVIFQLLSLYIYKKLATRNRVINTLFTIVFISPFTLLGLFFSVLLPRNSDLYLDNIVLARKK